MINENIEIQLFILGVLKNGRKWGCPEVFTLFDMTTIHRGSMTLDEEVESLLLSRFIKVVDRDGQSHSLGRMEGGEVVSYSHPKLFAPGSFIMITRYGTAFLSDNSLTSF